MGGSASAEEEEGAAELWLSPLVFFLLSPNSVCIVTAATAGPRAAAVGGSASAAVGGSASGVRRQWLR